MKGKESYLQQWGFIYIISLISFILSFDKILIFKQLGSLDKWNGCMYTCLFSFVFVLFSLKIIKNIENNNNKHKWYEKVMHMLTNTAKGSKLDIFVLLVFIAFMEWIPNTITGCIEEEKSWLRPILYIGGLSALVYGKPSIILLGDKVQHKERKLLLTGMSCVSNKPQMNVLPLIAPLETYHNIETLLILLSDTVWDNLDGIDPAKEKDVELANALQDYKNNMLRLHPGGNERLTNDKVIDVQKELGKLLRTYIKKNENYRNKEIKIVFSAPVDYNNFDACNDVCYEILKKTMKGTYHDRHVVVNTTPGTKMVTSAMAINSIKGNRAMIYMSQDGNGIVEANPDVSLTQFADLFAEREYGGIN